MALGHAPWIKEAKSTMREQQESRASVTVEAVTDAAFQSEHAATSPCTRQPTQIEQQATVPSPSAQSALACKGRSASMPPRAPQRPQTAPLKAAERSPTARPWTAHYGERNQGACQAQELGRTRASPGSGGSPTASCAPLPTENEVGSRAP